MKLGMTYKPISAILTSMVLVLAVAAMASSDILIDDAEAKRTQFTTPQVGDEIIIKGKGAGICTSGEDTVTTKTNVSFLFLVTEADGGMSTGVGTTKIQLQTKCEGAPKVFVNNGPLAFTLDADSGLIIISGNVIVGDGTLYSLDGVGVINLGKKTTIDMVLEMTSDPGVGVLLEIPTGGVVLMPVDG